MHLPLKETNVGSTPTAPTKDAPVTQLADVSGLNPDCCEFDSRRGYSGDRARAARQSHKLRSVSATLTPASTHAGVAQRQSNRLVSDGLQVQLLSPAPECDRGAAASTSGFHPEDTSSSLVDRSEPAMVLPAIVM